jgi:hypothetical protein
MNPCQVLLIVYQENLTTNTENTFLIAKLRLPIKDHSSWKIDGKNPYTTDNIYNDFAFKFASACSPSKISSILIFYLYSLLSDQPRWFI